MRDASARFGNSALLISSIVVLLYVMGLSNNLNCTKSLLSSDDPPPPPECAGQITGVGLGYCGNSYSTASPQGARMDYRCRVRYIVRLFTVRMLGLFFLPLYFFSIFTPFCLSSSACLGLIKTTSYAVSLHFTPEIAQLCVLTVTRYNSAQKIPIEAGSNQQPAELQPSLLSTRPHTNA